MICYSLEDYDDYIFKGIQYTLSNEVLHNIMTLEKEMNLTPAELQNSSSVTRESHSSTQNRRRGGGNSSNTVPKPTFKATVIEKKEGTEQQLNNIRLQLNKISTKNYDTLSVVILNDIESIVLLGHSEGVAAVAQSIFDIASSNKFYSEMYAQLLKELLNRFGDIFSTLLDQFVHNYQTALWHCGDGYCDEKTDPEAYYAYTKKRDLERATTVFLINLVRLGVLEFEMVLDLTTQLLVRWLEYVDREGQLHLVEEWTEHLFLFIQGRVVNENIVALLKQISCMKAKEHSSLSHRIVFRFKDMVTMADLGPMTQD